MHIQEYGYNFKNVCVLYVCIYVYIMSVYIYYIWDVYIYYIYEMCVCIYYIYEMYIYRNKRISENNLGNPHGIPER